MTRLAHQLSGPIALAMIAIAVVSWPAPAAGQDAGPRVTIEGSRTDNVYVAGGTVDVFGELEKDLVAAGGTVSVGRQVRGDVIVAGGAVHVGGVVGDDVRAVGGLVTVEGQVAGDLVAFGGDVILDRAARTGGRAWLSGGSVTVDGRVGRTLRVAAGTVTIGGEVAGDVTLVARAITVAPGARITGNLSYASPTPAHIAAGAHIGGRVSREAAPWGASARRAGRAVLRVLQAAAVLGLLVIGALLLVLFPTFTRAASRLVADAPWASLGAGFLALVVTPIVAIILMVTVIGIPLGVLTMALYVAAVVIGFLVGAIVLGDLVVRLGHRGGPPSAGLRVLGLVVVLVALALVTLIPVVGRLVQLVVLLLGLGALSLYVYRHLITGPPAAP